MPSGRTHDRITWVSTPPVGLVTWHYTGSLAETLAMGLAFLFAGLMFSGDLDLPSVQYKRWGPFRWIWKPYQWWIPHRSPLSHGILLGPLVRLAYMSAVLALFGGLAFAGMHWQGLAPAPDRMLAAGMQAVSLQEADWRLLAFAMGGLWIGGASHTLADQAGSAWGRFRRGGRNQRKGRSRAARRR